MIFNNPKLLNFYFYSCMSVPFLRLSPLFIPTGLKQGGKEDLKAISLSLFLAWTYKCLVQCPKGPSGSFPDSNSQSHSKRPGWGNSDESVHWRKEKIINIEKKSCWDFWIFTRKLAGENPFECQECGGRSRVSSDLINHQRTHSEEEPFKCQQCGERFRQSSDLNKHT